MFKEAIARDRRAVQIGAIVTAIATIVLFVIPELLLEEMDAFKLWYWEQTGRRIDRDNPLGPVRFLGGALGGAVAGYRTSALGSGGVNGAKAAVYGLAIMVVIVFVGLSGVYVYLGGPRHTPWIFNAVVPTLYALLLAAPHLIGGALAGAAAYRLHDQE